MTVTIKDTTAATRPSQGGDTTTAPHPRRAMDAGIPTGLTRGDSLDTITIPTGISPIRRHQENHVYRSTRLAPRINLIDTGQSAPDHAARA